VRPYADREDEPGDARAAMNRVLQAERRMADALDDCRRRGEDIVEQARLRARAIARRTDRRIQLLHQRCAVAADATTTRIESGFDAAATHHRIDSGDDDALQNAVERLASLLTTADSDDSEQ
jgi:vacuolar-type H+-ATPase subunit H